MAHLKSYSAKTHQGPYLHINEDDIDVDLINNLFLIFDGFGGSGIGNQCIETIKNNIKQFYTRISADAESTLPFFYSAKYLLEGNFLANAMHYSHKLFSKENFKKDMSQRGGASCVAGCLSESILTLASVGNCSVYILRKGILQQAVVPDSLANLSTDNYMKYFHTAPMSAFGLFEDLHLILTEVRVADGDLVVMLTDGVYSRLETPELKHILEKSPENSGQKISELFDISNSRGNLDNQSALILQF